MRGTRGKTALNRAERCTRDATERSCGTKKARERPGGLKHYLSLEILGQVVMITVDGDSTVADSRRSHLSARLCEIAGRPIVTAAPRLGLALSKAH